MNDFNTHGKIIKMGDTVAFVDGIPDECDHDTDGEGYMFDWHGNYYKDSEAPDHKTNPEEHFEWMKENNISGGCCSCSKCGKPYSPPMF